MNEFPLIEQSAVDILKAIDVKLTEEKFSKFLEELVSFGLGVMLDSSYRNEVDDFCVKHYKG